MAEGATGETATAGTFGGAPVQAVAPVRGATLTTASDEMSIDEDDMADDETELLQAFIWIGFNAGVSEMLCDEIGGILSSMLHITTKEIKTLGDTIKDRFGGNTGFVYRLKQMKQVQAMVYWVNDCERVGDRPTVVGHTQKSFIALLRTCKDRKKIREVQIERSESRAKEAMPSALKEGTDFLDWEDQLFSTLTLRYGAKGIPISYVIRENDEPERAGTFPNFNEECIARTPLSGPAFDQDNQDVHFLIQNLIAKQPAETFVKPHRKKKSGRADMIALRNHYKGHGNKAKLKAEAVALKNTLHYKNEKALTFDTYLQCVQKMIHLFEQAEEPMTAPSQLDFMLDNIQDESLQGNGSGASDSDELSAAGMQFGGREPVVRSKEKKDKKKKAKKST
jgi:hypothetical protein